MDKDASLGQRNHLSETDIFQINELYDCKRKPTFTSHLHFITRCFSLKLSKPIPTIKVVCKLYMNRSEILCEVQKSYNHIII